MKCKYPTSCFSCLLLKTVLNHYFLIPSNNTTYKYQQTDNILEFWQNVSAIKSHHQAKIEQCLGTMKVCTLWDPVSFTVVGTLKVIS